VILNSDSEAIAKGIPLSERVEWKRSLPEGVELTL
jgi:hypothetical protein